MEDFVIEGRHPIKGVITPSGNKNSMLPILAASLLTDEPVIVENMPRIRDADTMLSLLQRLGVQSRWLGEHELWLQAGHVHSEALDPEAFAEIRGSVLLAGPMLARSGRVTLPRPGGDAIGRRRIDTHLLALRELGAEISVDDNYAMMTDGLRGADILLDEMSVTATENALMAAALARGTTTIHNAASEPHVQDVAHMLQQMGAQVEGIGTNTLVVEGAARLRGVRFRLGVDYMEVGSFMGLAAVTGGELLIQNAEPHNLRMVCMMFRRLGLEIEIRGDDVYIPGNQRLRIQADIHDAVPKVEDAPWPGFPADLMSVMIVVASQAEGSILIHEKMFESRLFWVDKLIAMGARIILCDPHRAVVLGPSELHGEQAQSPDIRAGMALLLAALAARGKSVIHNAGVIDRGYERIAERLISIGAHIERVRR